MPKTLLVLNMIVIENAANLPTFSRYYRQNSVFSRILAAKTAKNPASAPKIRDNAQKMKFVAY